MGNKKGITIGTHNGVFHADDVLAVAALLVMWPNARVIRTRHQETLDACDIVVDVGGAYIPEKYRFDHHQRGGAGERENGVPYSSFGLVWKRYGSRVCRIICGIEGPKLGEPSQLAERVDGALVMAIDASDNGKHLIDGVPAFEGAQSQSLSRVIAGFNPLWDDEQQLFDIAFQGAVEFAQGVLKRQVLASASELRAVSEFTEACLAHGSGVAVLERFLPWAYNGTKVPEDILYVVYPSSNGETWMVQCVPPKPGSFEQRKPLPEAWAGLRDDVLGEVCGVKDAVFCHNGRFIGGAKSRAGALDMAFAAAAA